MRQQDLKYSREKEEEPLMLLRSGLHTRSPIRHPAWQARSTITALFTLRRREAGNWVEQGREMVSRCEVEFRATVSPSPPLQRIIDLDQPMEAIGDHKRRRRKRRCSERMRDDPEPSRRKISHSHENKEENRGCCVDQKVRSCLVQLNEKSPPQCNKMLYSWG